MSTPRDGPNSNTHAEACHCWSESPARESSAHRAFTGQGLTPCGRVCSPHRDDRSPRWIYPNLIDPSTPCRRSVAGTVWNHPTRRPCGNLGSFERIRQAHHASSAAHREGCHNRTLAKEARLRATPRVPSAVELTGLDNKIAGNACQVPGRIPLPTGRCLLVPCVFAALTCRETRGAGRVMTERTRRSPFGRDRSNLHGFCVWSRPAG